MRPSSQTVVHFWMIAAIWYMSACQPVLTATQAVSGDRSAPLNSRATAPASLKPRPMLKAPDSMIRYEIGNPNFRGRTTVEVTGDRQVTVRFEMGTQTDTYKGTLSEADFADFQKMLQANSPLSIKSAQTLGKPGEARIRLTVRTNQEEQSTEFWNSEQWQIPTLRNLVNRFNQLATTISGGKVRY